jgi:hypothetical protein
MTSWRSVSCRTVAAACTCAPPSLSLSLSLSLPLRVLLQMRRETDDGSKSAAVKSHSHGAWRAVVVVGGLQNVMAGIVESGVPESRVVLAGLGLGGTCAVHTATKHAAHELAGVISVGGGCVAPPAHNTLGALSRLTTLSSTSPCDPA